MYTHLTQHTMPYLCSQASSSTDQLLHVCDNYISYIMHDNSQGMEA